MIYKLDLSPQELKTLGFRYDHNSEDYTYEFPVYRSHGKTVLYCKIGIEEGTKLVWFNVYDNNRQLYTPYYNRTYGRSNVITIIDSNISKELLRLGAEEVEE